MIIGYLFETFLGFSFALGLEIIRSTPSNNPNPRLEKYRAIVLKGCSVFYDCALYFAASIQIACVVVLVRKDFGISANGLGGFTVQITWAVALLSLLPLLYPLVMLGIFVAEGSETEALEKELEKAETSRPRHEFRFYLFCACWVLFLYTFVSRMIGDFAPSQVGEGVGEGGTTVVNTSDWNTLSALCFTGVQQLTDDETKVIEGFGTAGSIIISLFVVCPFLWPMLQSLELGVVKSAEKKFSDSRENGRIRSLVPRAILVSVPLLTAPEIWGVFRIRNVQESLTNALGTDYTDNQWTFGQVVAVVIFAPVIVEVAYLSARHPS
jgi:hypothetical protein